MILSENAIRITMGGTPETLGPTEAEGRVHRLKSGLTLVNTVGIRLGKYLITTQTIQKDAEMWGNWALTPGIGKLQTEDERILRQILFGLMPLAIIGNTQETPLVLNAELKRFPYSIDGEEDFENFSLRLVPEKGRIDSVVLGEGHSVAIGSQKISPDSLSVDLGNSSLHLEIYFERQNPEDLPTLVAPEGFEEEVILRPLSPGDTRQFLRRAAERGF